jgi:pimeloyl-ACP methyl ester carboxylesterase
MPPVPTEPLFIFLHGGVQGSWVWAPTLEALTLQAPESRWLLLDIPGCGTKRGRDTDRITFDAIVEELVGDVEAAGISGAVLVGHSQAGSVLPRMAELAPERFRDLVYLSCIAPDPGQTVLVGSAGQEVADLPEEKRALPIERLRTMFCNDMGDEQAASFMASLGQDNWPRSAYGATDWRYDHLAGMPSTYILCMRDETLRPDLQRQFAQRLHADRLSYIDAGHQAMTTRPHALAEMLLLESAD